MESSEDQEFDPNDKQAIFAIIKRLYEDNDSVTDEERAFLERLRKDPNHWHGKPNPLVTAIEQMVLSKKAKEKVKKSVESDLQ